MFMRATDQHQPHHQAQHKGYILTPTSWATDLEVFTAKDVLRGKANIVVVAGSPAAGDSYYSVRDQRVDDEALPTIFIRYTGYRRGSYGNHYTALVPLPSLPCLFDDDD